MRFPVTTFSPVRLRTLARCRVTLVAVSTGVADRSVLLVEDDHALAASLRYSLEREDFRVSVSGDGAEAIETIRRDRPVLVLLDLVLPGMTGFDVCRLIRKESNVPILILTCRGSEADRVTGLELGADGYMTKPFSVTELVWRVRAMIRRAAIAGVPAEPSLLRFGPVEMDLGRHEATVRAARRPTARRSGTPGSAADPRPADGQGLSLGPDRQRQDREDQRRDSRHDLGAGLHPGPEAGSAIICTPDADCSPVSRVQSVRSRVGAVRRLHRSGRRGHAPRGRARHPHPGCAPGAGGGTGRGRLPGRGKDGRRQLRRAARPGRTRAVRA